MRAHTQLAVLSCLALLGAGGVCLAWWLDESAAVASAPDPEAEPGPEAELPGPTAEENERARVERTAANEAGPDVAEAAMVRGRIVVHGATGWEAVLAAGEVELLLQVAGDMDERVLPVVGARLADFVEGDHAIDDTLQLEPSPGHSPGHVFLNLETEHGSAVFTGDVMHHPVQIAYPEWNSRFCYDPPQSQRTREAIVERTADTSTLVLAAHFAMPVAGHIVSNPGGNGDRCKFQGVSQQGGRLLTES